MPRLLLLAFALCLVLAAPAAAAERRVPPGWLGVMADGPLTEGGANRTEWSLMATTGVESVRTAFYWPHAQRRSANSIDLVRFDRIVLAAARRRMPVLPVVHGTPSWAASRPGDESSPPSDPADFARFLEALVARYGPDGSLWSEHPKVPPQPIREWQIWNEPNLSRYWSERPWAPGYVQLLGAARAALRAADPAARLILAGLPNESWSALRAIYRNGGRDHFDAVALHPYTGKPRNVVRLIELARREMRLAGDGLKPVWVTELSWPAAKGRTQVTRGFEVTDEGQASRLRDALRLLAGARERLRIERVFWYTWLSGEGTRNSFAYSGLRRLNRGRVRSVPALWAFRSEGLRLNGCRKRRGDASRCR